MWFDDLVAWEDGVASSIQQLHLLKPLDFLEVSVTLGQIFELGTKQQQVTIKLLIFERRVFFLVIMLLETFTDIFFRSPFVMGM